MFEVEHWKSCQAGDWEGSETEWLPLDYYTSTEGGDVESGDDYQSQRGFSCLKVKGHRHQPEQV